MQNDLREAVGRLQFFADGLSVSTIWSADRFDNQTPFELIRSDLKTVLALLSARPLALGGQHSTATDFPPDDVLACDTTPARAEAQDEGAAGELAAAITLLTEKADQTDAAASKVEDWHSAMPGDVRAEMKAEVAAIRTVLAAVRAHPSPTPAADADGVIRVLERICETQKRLYGNGTGLHLAMLDLCIDARAELSLYRAALKSTAAKEGGEK